MTNLMETFEKQQIEKLTIKKRIPTFRPGDTLKVTIKITEGDKSRLQAYEGICIARKNNSINSNFTVRKISHGEGVERVFPLFSPSIDKIEIIRKGDVKRAKLYYLRDRTGKRARIADRDRGDEADQYAMLEETPTEDSSSNKIEAVTENKNKIKEQNQETELVEKEFKENVSKETIAQEKPAKETTAEEKKEEAPAEKAEQKTDEQP